MNDRQPSDPYAAEYRLVARAQEGDQTALAVLYETYFDRIYRYSLARIGNVTEAEDLTEEVFLRMLRGIGLFKWQPNGFGPWLFRIAHNLIIDSFRRQNHQITYLPRLADMFIDERAEDDLARWCDEEELAGAILRLTPAQRDVITLRFAAGLSLAETAEVLGKQVGNIKVLQHNALIALRRLLTKTEGSSGKAVWKKEPQNYLNAAYTES